MTFIQSLKSQLSQFSQSFKHLVGINIRRFHACALLLLKKFSSRIVTKKSIFLAKNMTSR